MKTDYEPPCPKCKKSNNLLPAGRNEFFCNRCENFFKREKRKLIMLPKIKTIKHMGAVYREALEIAPPSSEPQSLAPEMSWTHSPPAVQAKLDVFFEKFNVKEQYQKFFHFTAAGKLYVTLGKDNILLTKRNFNAVMALVKTFRPTDFIKVPKANLQ